MDEEKANALLKWVNTMEMGEPTNSLKQLSSGLLLEIVYYIDKEYELAEEPNNDHSNALGKVISYLESFYQQSIKSFIDENEITNHENILEIGKVLSLLLYCAIQGDNVSDVVDKITKMNEDVQMQIKIIIEAVLKEVNCGKITMTNITNVLGQSDSGTEHQEFIEKSEYHSSPITSISSPVLQLKSPIKALMASPQMQSRQSKATISKLCKKLNELQVKVNAQQLTQSSLEHKLEEKNQQIEHQDLKIRSLSKEVTRIRGLEEEIQSLCCYEKELTDVKSECERLKRKLQELQNYKQNFLNVEKDLSDYVSENSVKTKALEDQLKQVEKRSRDQILNLESSLEEEYVNNKRMRTILLEASAGETALKEKIKQIRAAYEEELGNIKTSLHESGRREHELRQEKDEEVLRQIAREHELKNCFKEMERNLKDTADQLQLENVQLQQNIAEKEIRIKGKEQEILQEFMKKEKLFENSRNLVAKVEYEQKRNTEILRESERLESCLNTSDEEKAVLTKDNLSLKENVKKLDVLSRECEYVQICLKSSCEEKEILMKENMAMQEEIKQINLTASNNEETIDALRKKNRVFKSKLTTTTCILNALRDQLKETRNLFWIQRKEIKIIHADFKDSCVKLVDQHVQCKQKLNEKEQSSLAVEQEKNIIQVKLEKVAHVNTSQEKIIGDKDAEIERSRKDTAAIQKENNTLNEILERNKEEYLKERERAEMLKMQLIDSEGSHKEECLKERERAEMLKKQLIDNEENHKEECLKERERAEMLKKQLIDNEERKKEEYLKERQTAEILKKQLTDNEERHKEECLRERETAEMLKKQLVDNEERKKEECLKERQRAEMLKKQLDDSEERHKEECLKERERAEMLKKQLIDNEERKKEECLKEQERAEMLKKQLIDNEERNKEEHLKERQTAKILKKQLTDNEERHKEECLRERETAEMLKKQLVDNEERKKEECLKERQRAEMLKKQLDDSEERHKEECLKERERAEMLKKQLIDNEERKKEECLKEQERAEMLKKQLIDNEERKKEEHLKERQTAEILKKQLIDNEERNKEDCLKERETAEMLKKQLADNEERHKEECLKEQERAEILKKQLTDSEERHEEECLKERERAEILKKQLIDSEERHKEECLKEQERAEILKKQLIDNEERKKEECLKERQTAEMLKKQLSDGEERHKEECLKEQERAEILKKQLTDEERKKDECLKERETAEILKKQLVDSEARHKEECMKERERTEILKKQLADSENEIRNLNEATLRLKIESKEETLKLNEKMEFIENENLRFKEHVSKLEEGVDDLEQMLVEEEFISKRLGLEVRSLDAQLVHADRQLRQKQKTKEVVLKGGDAVREVSSKLVISENPTVSEVQLKQCSVKVDTVYDERKQEESNEDTIMGTILAEHDVSQTSMVSEGKEVSERTDQENAEVARRVDHKTGEKQSNRLRRRSALYQTQGNNEMSVDEKRRSTVGCTFFVVDKCIPEDEPKLFDYDYDWDRIVELKRRNATCLPHMRSSYPVETQVRPEEEVEEEELKSGHSKSSLSRKRLRENASDSNLSVTFHIPNDTKTRNNRALQKSKSDNLIALKDCRISNQLSTKKKDKLDLLKFEANDENCDLLSSTFSLDQSTCSNNIVTQCENVAFNVSPPKKSRRSHQRNTIHRSFAKSDLSLHEKNKNLSVNRKAKFQECLKKLSRKPPSTIKSGKKPLDTAD